MAMFTNQAKLSYKGTVINSNTVTGQLVEVLTASKTAIMDDYVAGDDITYVISINNSGTAAFTGLTVTDNLGAYPFDSTVLVPLTYVPGSMHYYIGGVLQPTPSVSAGPPLVITGITVPAGGNTTLIYEVNANAYAPLGSCACITNTAAITGGGLSSAIRVSERICTQDTPVLTISKAICPSTVVENGTLTYTFVIENTGSAPATAADAIVVTDTFSPILNPIYVTFNGIAWSSPTYYSYNTSTGVFATVAGKITVPAATYYQDPIVGNWIITPGVGTLTITGTV